MIRLLPVLLLAACAAPEPTVVYRTQEVKVEVPVACPIELRQIGGPDFAPADSNVEWAAVYAGGRILALRGVVEYYRQAIEACRRTVEEDSGLRR